MVTAHTALVVHHPLRASAERAAAATLRVVVRDDPATDPRPPAYGSQPGSAAQVLVPAVLTRVEVGDDRWTTGGRVLLIVPAEGWAALLPGQAVTADGLLAPAGRRDLTVAVLRVRGPPREVTPPSWWQSAAGGLAHAGFGRPPVFSRPRRRGCCPGSRSGTPPGSLRRSRTTSGPRVSPTCSAVSGANLAIVGRSGARADAAAADRSATRRRAQRGHDRRVRGAGPTVAERGAGRRDGGCRAARAGAGPRPLRAPGAGGGRAGAAAGRPGTGGRPWVRACPCRPPRRWCCSRPVGPTRCAAEGCRAGPRRRSRSRPPRSSSPRRWWPG